MTAEKKIVPEGHGDSYFSMTVPSAALERFRNGDTEAFARIVEVYGGRARSIAARYFRDLFDQEEAVQEVWVHLYKNRQALDPARLDEFPGWLATLTRRRCVDLARSRGRLGGTAGLDDEAAAEPPASPAPDPIEQQELRAAVDLFKSRLRPAWREFFELCFVQGLGYAEIAERLSVSKLRCKYMKKVLLARARRYQPLMEALGRWAGARSRHAS